MTWMCELCFPEGKEIKILFDGLSLIYDEGKYHLLEGQGHGKSDILITFDNTPWPDPYPEILDDDIWQSYEPTEEQWELSNTWMEEASLFDKKMKFDPETGYWLIKNFKEIGYGKNPSKEHLYFDNWLYDYIGKIIHDSTL